MTDWMTLDEVEERIHAYYTYMYRSISDLRGEEYAKSVRIVEEGELKALWGIADRYYENARSLVSAEEYASEYGPGPGGYTVAQAKKVYP